MLGCWEEFEDGPTEPRENRLHVTLSPRCVIHLNGNVFEKLGKPAFVRLLFDRLNSRIGILPATALHENAFPVKVKGKGRHRIIWALPFCRYYGIHFHRIRSFQDAEIDEDGILRLDLLRTVPVVSRARKNSRSNSAAGQVRGFSS
jgi:hypothetical protein